MLAADLPAVLDDFPMVGRQLGNAFFFGDLDGDVFVPFAGIGHKAFLVDLDFFACNCTGCHSIASN